MTELSFPMPASRELIQPTPSLSASATYGGSRALFREAAKQFGANLEDYEDDNWRGLLCGAYLVDHLLDVERTAILPPLASVINGNFLGGLNIDSQIRFRNYMVQLKHDEYETVLHKINSASRLATEQRVAVQAHEVIDIRLEEAEILASLLALDQNGPSAHARGRFNDWLRGWSRAGYLVDSFVDMHEDYENGDSGLEPTIKARLALGKATMAESLAAAKKTPPKLLGKCAMVAVRYVGLGRKPEIAHAAR